MEEITSAVEEVVFSSEGVYIMAKQQVDLMKKVNGEMKILYEIINSAGD